VATVAVAGVGFVGWLFGWSEMTELERVHVDGADGQVTAVVLDVADAPLGTPLIRIDLDAIKERVGEVPDVADVEVRRSWWRSLEIEVTAREPVATLEDDGSWWLVDAEGVVFGESENRDDGVLVLEAPTGTDLPAVAARIAGISVFAGLPDDIRDLVETVAAPSEGAVSLVLADGRTVLWGTDADGARKADVLRALLAEVDGTRIDISAPDFPAVSSD
jgi:cell division protein FtsQ